MAREAHHGRGHIVTIFGSSRAQRDDKEYNAARRLGQLIARHGWTVCNGGHDGTMEAAARGAKEEGGATIGVTISLYESSKPNVWLDEEVVAESLFARLEKLVTLGDAFVVLRGGIGTLLELALIWNLGQAPHFADKPILVVGPDWRRILDSLHRNLPMWPWELSRLTPVATVDEAIERLGTHFDGVIDPRDRTPRPWRGGLSLAPARRAEIGACRRSAHRRCAAGDKPPRYYRHSDATCFGRS